ncbi:16S rRNA (uracil(1498)-N(3))-methyltransferase [Scrofimicrobium sp. R131]|uniref:Ribosomal RNA small subunit methyltransferase E n=1 Tax=Scrofimicrobium appendicitidis TaxID=3079930 RepID=A0AAU7V8E5_9ACTO
MTLPVFFAPELLGADRDDRGAALSWSGPEADHARKVMRLGPADRLDLVDGAGTRATCVIESVSSTGVELTVAESRVEPAPAVTVTLVQALAKGGRDEQAVELCTELGVDRIVPWSAQRSIARWPADRAEKSRQKWVNVVRAATKQSRRAFLPVVDQLVDSGRLAQQLAEISRRGGLVLICDEEGTRTLTDQVHMWEQTAGEIVVVVGPEGGLTDAERDAFRDGGGQLVLIGPTVLRSSTAGGAALTLVNVLTGRWR